MQHQRETNWPKPPRELERDWMTPEEAMARIRKMHPGLLQSQVEMVHQRLMYYAHGTPNGVTPHVLETMMQEAARYAKMNGERNIPST